METPYIRTKVGAYTPPAHLLPRHYQILDLYIQGFKKAEISRQLSIDSRQVYNICASPVFQHQVSLRRDSLESQLETSSLSSHNEVQDIIKSQTLSAINKLGLLIDSESDAVSRQACNDLLAYAGVSKVSSTNLTTPTITIDTEQLQLLSLTLSEVTSPNSKQLEPSVSSDTETKSEPDESSPLCGSMGPQIGTEDSQVSVFSPPPPEKPILSKVPMPKQNPLCDFSSLQQSSLPSS